MIKIVTKKLSVYFLFFIVINIGFLSCNYCHADQARLPPLWPRSSFDPNSEISRLLNYFRIYSELASISDQEEESNIANMTHNQASINDQEEESSIADVSEQANSNKLRKDYLNSEIIDESIFEINNQISTLISNRLCNMQRNILPTGEKQGYNKVMENNRRQNSLWVAPLISFGEHKKTTDSLGYMNSSFGIAIGIDGVVSDQVIIGISATGVNKEVDTNIISNYRVSIYGMYLVSNKLYVQGVASVGELLSFNNNKKDSLLALDFQNSLMFLAEMQVGYIGDISSNITITPLVGVRYSAHDNNLENGNIIEPMLNIKCAANQGAISGSINGNVSYRIKEEHMIKNAIIKNMSYGVGGTIEYKSNNISILVGYDIQALANYFAHQLVTQLQVNI